MEKYKFEQRARDYISSRNICLQNRIAKAEKKLTDNPLFRTIRQAEAEIQELSGRNTGANLIKKWKWEFANSYRPNEITKVYYEVPGICHPENTEWEFRRLLRYQNRVLETSTGIYGLHYNTDLFHALKVFESNEDAISKMKEQIELAAKNKERLFSDQLLTELLFYEDDYYLWEAEDKELWKKLTQG
jgi:hypothetical protein